MQARVFALSARARVPRNLPCVATAQLRLPAERRLQAGYQDLIGYMHMQGSTVS